MTPLAVGVVVVGCVLVARGRSGSARRLQLPPPPAASPLAGAVVGVCVVAALLADRVPIQVPMLAAAAVLIVRKVHRRRSQRLLRGSRAADVTTFCFAVAAELRAGRAPADALTAVAAQLPAIGIEVGAAGRACRRGATVADELGVIAAAAGCERLRVVAGAWAATGTSGARAADLIERIGVALAHDDEAAAELQAHVAGPQATVVVLALLPLAAAALGAAVGAQPTRFLLHTDGGWLLMGVSAGLDTLGVVWMRRIVGRALAQ